MGAIRNSTASAPGGPALALRQGDLEARALHRQLGQALAHGARQPRRGLRPRATQHARGLRLLGTRRLELGHPALERDLGARELVATLAAPLGVGEDVGATFGAATRATFTAIVFLFELTHDYNSILPLMLATVLAVLVAGFLSSRQHHDREADAARPAGSVGLSRRHAAHDDRCRRS